jgi:hypothetical protein
MYPSRAVLEPVQEWSDARRKEALRAERTILYVSTQGRLTTQQMAVPGQAPAQKKGEAHCWASPVVLLVEPPYGVRMVMVCVDNGG